MTAAVILRPLQGSVVRGETGCQSPEPQVASFAADRRARQRLFRDQLRFGSARLLGPLRRDSLVQLCDARLDELRALVERTLVLSRYPVLLPLPHPRAPIGSCGHGYGCPRGSSIRV